MCKQHCPLAPMQTPRCMAPVAIAQPPGCRVVACSVASPIGGAPHFGLGGCLTPQDPFSQTKHSILGDIWGAKEEPSLVPGMAPQVAPTRPTMRAMPPGTTPRALSVPTWGPHSLPGLVLGRVLLCCSASTARLKWYCPRHTLPSRGKSHPPMGYQWFRVRASFDYTKHQQEMSEA